MQDYVLKIIAKDILSGNFHKAVNPPWLNSNQIEQNLVENCKMEVALNPYYE